MVPISRVYGGGFSNREIFRGGGAGVGFCGEIGGGAAAPEYFFPGPKNSKTQKSDSKVTVGDPFLSDLGDPPPK